MKTEDLIGAMAQDGLGRRDVGGVIGAALAVGLVVAAALFFALIGFRPDIGVVITSPRFLLKFAVTIPLAVAASALLWRLARPGVRVGLLGWSLALAPLVLAAGVLGELTVLPESAWVRNAVGSNSRNCLTIIPLLSLGPLACLLLALRQGAPTRPGLAGALAGLAASGMAASLYASNCTDDSPLFVVTWYPLAIALVVLLGFLGGRRLLRW